jgi:lipopolysaccharide cholinephosphotransferase
MDSKYISKYILIVFIIVFIIFLTCILYRNYFILPRLKDKFLILHKNLKKILPDLLKILKKYNIKNFITAGTLLGYKRNKKIIPWDDDIDIAIIDEDNIKQKFENIKSDLHKENKYYIINYIFGYKFILKEDENVFIDLFLYKQNGDKFLLNQIAERIWPNEFYFIEDIFPIRQDDFENIIVNIPNNCEPYLINTFGKNYDIPKLTHIHNNDINIFDKAIVMLIQKIPLSS